MGERNCNTCTHASETLTQEPCRSCFGKDYYPNWESARVAAIVREKELAEIISEKDKEIAEQFSRACAVTKELREKMRKDADEWEKLAQRLLERAEKAEAELAKWTRKHDDKDLQEMREQASQLSLTAKQFYINALEHHLRHEQAENAVLRERLRQYELVNEINNDCINGIVGAVTGKAVKG